MGGPHRQAVLGLLALQPNVVVHRESIIDALWGERPPATAVTMVHSYVSQLRKLLPGGRDGERVDAQQLLLADDLGAGRIAVAEGAVGPLPGDPRAMRVAAGQPGHGGSRKQWFGGQRHPQASLCAT